MSLVRAPWVAWSGTNAWRYGVGGTGGRGDGVHHRSAMDRYRQRPCCGLSAKQKSQALGLCSYRRDVVNSLGFWCLCAAWVPLGLSREVLGPAKLFSSLQPPFRFCTSGKDAGCSDLLHPSHGSLCQKTDVVCPWGERGDERAVQCRRLSCKLHCHEK